MAEEPTRDPFEEPTPPRPSSEAEPTLPTSSSEDELSLPEWNFETSSFELKSAPRGASFEVEPNLTSSFEAEPTQPDSRLEITGFESDSTQTDSSFETTSFESEPAATDSSFETTSFESEPAATDSSFETTSFESEPALTDSGFETTSYESEPALADSGFETTRFEVESTPPSSSFEVEPTPAESGSSEDAIPWIGGEPELETVPRTDLSIGSPPPPPRVRRSVSPWWALLILPVGLVAGWGIGRLPAPRPGPTVAPESVTETASTTEAIETAAPDTSAAPKPAPTPVGVEAEPADKPKEPVFSQWTSLQIAMVESDLNQKPILIDFNAAWCGPCKQMKEQVFDDQVLGPAVQAAVIPVSILDRVREDGRNATEIQNLQANFQVKAFPTLVVFFPATGKAVKTQGYPGPEATVEWITKAAESVR